MIDLDEWFIGLVRVTLVLVGYLLWRRAGRHVYSARAGSEARQSTSQPPEGGKVIELTRGLCHYRIDGAENKGKLVVMVHGLIGCHLDFQPLVKVLVEEQHRRVLRFDLYGRGWSSAPLMATDSLPELYAGQLVELLYSLGEDQPIDLIGNSMGGPIAACFAARFGRAHVASLTLTVPAGMPSMEKRLPTWTKRLVDVVAELPLAMHLLKGFAKSRVLTLADNTKVHWTTKDNKSVQNWYLEYQGRRLQREHNLAGSFIESVSLFPFAQSQGLYEAVAENEVPTLVFWGKSDRKIPFECAAEMRLVFDKARALLEEQVVDESGHLLVIERADFVAKNFGPFSRKN